MRNPLKFLVAGLSATVLAAPAALAADLHWFYDRTSEPRYEDREYNGYKHRDHGRQKHYRHYEPEPEYSIYQPKPKHGYDDNGYGNGYGNGHAHGARLSCLQGVENLQDAGFRHIEVVDCENGTYVYDAVRHREPWRIRVSRASGDIVDVYRLGN